MTAGIKVIGTNVINDGFAFTRPSTEYLCLSVVICRCIRSAIKYTITKRDIVWGFTWHQHVDGRRRLIFSRLTHRRPEGGGKLLLPPLDTRPTTLDVQIILNVVDITIILVLSAFQQVLHKIIQFDLHVNFMQEFWHQPHKDSWVKHIGTYRNQKTHKNQGYKKCRFSSAEVRAKVYHVCKKTWYLQYFCFL